MMTVAKFNGAIERRKTLAPDLGIVADATRYDDNDDRPEASGMATPAPTPCSHPLAPTNSIAPYRLLALARKSRPSRRSRPIPYPNR